MEKQQLEYTDSSKLTAFWHSRTIRIPTQVSKSIFRKSNNPPKTENFRETSKREIKSVVMGKYEQEYREYPQKITAEKTATKKAEKRIQLFTFIVELFNRFKHFSAFEKF